MSIFTTIRLLATVLALSAILASSQDSRDIGTDQANVSQILQSALARQSASPQLNQAGPGVLAPVNVIANTSQIFSINKAEAMNITAVNTLGGQWVQIANIGMSNRNLTGWRLANKEGTFYIFPNIIVPVNGIVRVHQGSGQNIITDLYTNIQSPLLSGSDDFITLTDNSGRLIARYQNPQQSVALAQDLIPPAAAIIAGPAALPQPAPEVVYVSPPEGTTGIAMPVLAGDLVNASPSQGEVINQGPTTISAGGPAVTVSGV